MSFETNLNSIAKSLESIADSLKLLTQNKTIAAPVAPTQQAITQPAINQIVAPIEPVAAVVPPVATPIAPVVAPVVAAPVIPATVSPSNCPIVDQKTLIEYVMSKYQSLGPVKGAQIQTVLQSIGYQNINEVKSEHFAEFHTKVEAL